MGAARGRAVRRRAAEAAAGRRDARLEAGLNPAAVAFEPAVDGDAEALVAIRIAAMRESLERVGRFDPQRVRDRFLGAFDPSVTRHVVVDGQRVGFVVVRPQDDGLLLDHLYVLPSAQGRGVGTAVMADVLAAADARGLSVRVGALRESAANRFYECHGFRLVQRTQWDNLYARPARPSSPRAPGGPAAGSANRGVGQSTS